MRYKIKTKTQAGYRKAKSLVERQTRIWVASERRMLLSADDLSSELQDELRCLGADVLPDYQYNADAA